MNECRSFTLFCKQAPVSASITRRHDAVVNPVHALASAKSLIIIYKKKDGHLDRKFPSAFRSVEPDDPVSSVSRAL